MIKRIYHVFLKYLYKLLIFKVIILDKDKFTHYEKLNTFCEYEIESNKGKFVFIFKEDRRKHPRSKMDSILMLNSYLVELKIPPNLELKRTEISDKIIIVIKLVIFSINYKVLSEILLDLYINAIVKLINERSTSDLDGKIL